MIYEDKWIFEGDSRIEMTVLIIILRYWQGRFNTTTNYICEVQRDGGNHLGLCKGHCWTKKKRLAYWGEPFIIRGVTLTVSNNRILKQLSPYRHRNEPLLRLYLYLLNQTENMKIYIEKMLKMCWRGVSY